MNKQTEYLVLNNQILALEKNVFERTALIGFIGFPCLGIMDNGFYYWIPFFVMLLLIFNVSHTMANLKKAIHLKIYLQMVLETNQSYLGWTNFFVSRENYKNNYKKEILKIMEEYEDFEDITIEKNVANLFQGMTIVFLILYLIITIIFMASESSYEFTRGRDQLAPMPLVGGFLGILTAIVGIIQVSVIRRVNIVAEKAITEKFLSEIQQQNN